MNTTSVFLFVSLLFSFFNSGQLTTKDSTLFAAMRNNMPAYHSNYKFNEIISEADQKVEDWMTVPFHTTITEDDLVVESWMEESFLECLK